MSRWATVEVFDESLGEVLAHILPVEEVFGFATEAEAIAFLERCDLAGGPVLTDADDTITATYFGHTLTPGCICEPTQDSVHSELWVHRQAN